MNVAVASVLPATAIAAPSITSPNNPDERLIALGIEYDAARAAEKKHERKRKRAFNKYEKMEHPFPEACRWRPTDADIGFDLKPWAGCPAMEGSYTGSEVDKLRNLPDDVMIDHSDWIEVPGYSKVIGFRTETITANKVRAAEIVKAYDDYITQKEELKEKLGLLDWEDDPESQRIYKARSSLELEISRTHAHTLEGLVVKAKVVLAYEEIEVSDDGNDCEAVLGRLAENIIALTDRRLS